MGVLNELEYKILGLLLAFESGVFCEDTLLIELVTLSPPGEPWSWSPRAKVLLIMANEALRIAFPAVGGV